MTIILAMKGTGFCDSHCGGARSPSNEAVIRNDQSLTLEHTVTLQGGTTIQGESADARGAVANDGALEIAGPATLLDDVVTNADTSVVKVDGGQTLTLSDTEISGGGVSGAGTIDVTGDSTIDGSATLNTSFVTVESGKTLTLDDMTVSGTAITANGTGAVNVDSGKMLSFNGAKLTGGKLNVSGTLDSTNVSSITNTDIVNSSLIEAIGGVLALVATTAATITNDGTIQAKVGELDINDENVANNDTLAAIEGGTLKLVGMQVTNASTGACRSIPPRRSISSSALTISPVRCAPSGDAIAARFSPLK